MCAINISSNIGWSGINSILLCRIVRWYLAHQLHFGRKLVISHECAYLLIKLSLVIELGHANHVILNKSCDVWLEKFIHIMHHHHASSSCIIIMHVLFFVMGFRDVITPSLNGLFLTEPNKKCLMCIPVHSDLSFFLSTSIALPHIGSVF